MNLYIYITEMPCQGTTQKGKPCKNPPIKGLSFCYQHQIKLSEQPSHIIQNVAQYLDPKSLASLSQVNRRFSQQTKQKRESLSIQQQEKLSPKSVEINLTNYKGDQYEYMLGTKIDTKEYPVDQLKRVIFPLKHTYTIEFPYNRDEDQIDPLVYESVQIQGPVTLGQFADLSIKFYQKHHPTENFDVTDMGFRGFEKVKPFVYQAHVYY